MFRAQFRLSGDFVPDSRIEHDLFNGGQILSYDFRDKVRAKTLNATKGAIARFTKSGVVLNDGTEMEADVVVFGTGFKKSYAYLDANTQALLGREEDGLWLYRNIFPTRVANLCFIGAEVSTFNNILTQGLQSLWLQRVLTGQLSLPLPEKRDEDIENQKQWKRSWMPAKGDRAAILQLHKMKYHDQLCKDMGVKHKRKGWNILGECFAPYTAADYRSLFLHRRTARNVPTLLGTHVGSEKTKLHK
jgi:dimethylaniline monooxygenase (N-oxide forming)